MTEKSHTAVPQIDYVYATYGRHDPILGEPAGSFSHLESRRLRMICYDDD